MSELIDEMRAAMMHVSWQYLLLPGLVYRSFYDFVAMHGIEYPIVPFIGEIYPARHCFGNAIANAVLFNLRYVEGFAVSPVNGDIILHAWNADAAGNVHDATWRNTGAAYLGVEFSVERADDAIWNGNGCILNDENRGYPIFRQIWKGEDFSIQWPYSDRLEALRRRDLRIAESVRDWVESTEGKRNA